MRSDESAGGGAGDAAAPPGEMDPAVQQVIEQFAEMQVAMLGEVAAIEDAHRRLRGDARSRLEKSLGADHPRVQSLRSAVEESDALADTLRAVIGRPPRRRGPREGTRKAKRPSKRRQ